MRRFCRKGAIYGDVSNTLIGDGKIERAPLKTMRAFQEDGIRWAAYQNHDLGHPDAGRLAFLQYGGPKSTFKTPPPRYPDTESVGLGWRYVLVGEVDLKEGKVVPVEVPIT